MWRNWLSVVVAGLALMAWGCGDSEPARTASAPEASSSEPAEPAEESQDAAPAENADASGDDAKPEEAQSKDEMKSDESGDAEASANSDAPDEGDTKEAALEKLKTIASAMQAFDEQNKHFPPAAISDAAGKPLLSWRVALLPLLGEEGLYKEFHLDEPWDSQHNQPLAKRMPDIYRTPGGPAPPKTCYVVPLGAGSVISPQEAMSSHDMQRTLKNTAVVVEVNPQSAVLWTQPQDWRFVPANPAIGLGKLRDGEFCCGMADGSPRAFSKEMSGEALRALFNATAKKPADLESGETAGDDVTSEAKAEEGLLARAKAAFAEGHETQGLALLMAQAVVQGDGEVLDTLRWCPALKLPRLITRWGIAVQSPLANKSRMTFRRSRYSEDAPEEEPSEGGAGEGQQFWQENFVRPLIQQLELRVTAGHFGDWLKGDPQASGDVGPSGDAGEADTHLPGIVVFSAGKISDARQRAEKEKLDVLLVVEITPRPPVMNRTQSILTPHIFDVHLPENDKSSELWPPSKSYKGPKAINVVQVTAAKEGLKRGDPVKELIDELMKFVDDRLCMTSMPTISHEVALRRAENLVSQTSHDYPLPSLMELRYYQHKQILTPEEVTAHYGTLVGEEDGRRLAGGSESERQGIVARWLPKDVKEKD